jgi:nitrogenase subunit NifH
MWKDGEWSPMQPSTHLSTLSLRAKFEELEDKEAQYLINSHDIFDRPEYKAIISVNEIVSKIHESNSKSLSAIIVNEHEESRHWNLQGWKSKLQASLISFIAASLFSIVALSIIL